MEAQTMNVISSTKVSAAFMRTKGPPPANVPQTAKPQSMRAAVAVSRWPHRSAAHNSGRMARKLNEVRITICSMSGLNATRPTTLAAMPDAKNLSHLSMRKSLRAQRTITGVMTSAPARSRIHHVSQRTTKFAQSADPARHMLPVAKAAPIMVLGARLTIANFATPAAVSKVPRPLDHMLMR